MKNEEYVESGKLINTIDDFLEFQDTIPWSSPEREIRIAEIKAKMEAQLILFPDWQFVELNTMIRAFNDIKEIVDAWESDPEIFDVQNMSPILHRFIIVANIAKRKFDDPNYKVPKYKK